MCVHIICISEIYFIAQQAEKNLIEMGKTLHHFGKCVYISIEKHFVVSICCFRFKLLKQCQQQLIL